MSALRADLGALIAQAVDANGDRLGEVSGRAQLIGVIGTLLFLALVIELVRRRKLVERYALLWMIIALFGVVLAVWNDGLNWLSDRVGIESPTNALFLIGLVAIIGMLLNFSAAISRLSEETKILAQTISRLDAEVRELRGEGPSRNGDGDAPATAADEAETRAQPAESETEDA